MHHSRWLPIGIMIFTGITLGLTLTGTGPKIVLGLLSLPFVLALPGYALVLALFPGDKLELSERVAFSLGLSLVLVALGSLGLNLTPWGLRTETWAAYLGGITLIASGLALARSPRRMPTPVPSPVTPVTLRLSLDQGWQFVLALVIALVAFGLAYLGEIRQDSAGFTQLWLLPVENSVPKEIQVGVTSHEQDVANYRVYVEADGKPLLDEAEITLRPKETWSTSITLSDEAALATNITARLYRLYTSQTLCQGDQPPASCSANDEIYRQVVLWNQR